jgi:hypothetical protein
MAGGTGNKGTVAFVQAGGGAPTYTIVPISIPAWSAEVQDIPDTTLASDGFEESMPGDLAACPLLEIPVEYDGLTSTILANVRKLGTITVSYPHTTGGATAATLVGSGYIKGYRLPELQNNVKKTGVLLLKFDGKTGPTFTNQA